MAEQQPDPKTPQDGEEYIQRKEIRTMQRDTTHLREGESQKERERIRHLETEKDIAVQKELAEKMKMGALEQKAQQTTQEREQQRRDVQTRQDQREKEHAERQKRAQQRIQEEQQRLRQQVTHRTISPLSSSGTQEQPPPIQETPKEPSKGPTSFSRLLARFIIVILVAFILFNILLFGYWQLQQQGIIGQLPFPSIPFLSTGPAPPPPPPPAPPPAVIPPQQLTLGERLELPGAITTQFTNPRELLSRFSDFLSQQNNPGLLHLKFWETPNTSSITAVRFFELTEVSIPEVLKGQLKGDTVFFKYTYEVGGRWGFVSEIEDEGKTQEIFENWESSIEFDMVSISSLLGPKGSAYTSQFRTKSPEGVPIHYQTFSLQDTGIVYAIVDEKFLIFSNSYEATRVMIAQIRSSL